MNTRLIALAALVLSSCATAPRGYENATTWQYLGNESFQVSARGNNNTSPETVQRYLVDAAVEACFTNFEKGFRFVDSSDTSRVSGITQYGRVRYSSGGTAIVQCEGAPDPHLVQRMRDRQSAQAEGSGGILDRILSSK
jgi:hypothetical protein